MISAADAGKHYTLQRAYADLIGQDAASEKSEKIDLLRFASCAMRTRSSICSDVA
jgi:hypothetical protein